MKNLAAGKRLTWAFLLGWLISRVLFFSIVGQFSPNVFHEFYEPFIQDLIRSPNVDPWTLLSNLSNYSETFQSGWPNLLLLITGYYLGQLFGAGWIGYLILAMSFDLLALVLLMAIRSPRSEIPNFIAGAYVFSPLPLLSIYMDGSLDFLPMLLLMAALFLLGLEKPIMSGVVLGIAVATNPVIAVVLVGALIYFPKSRRPKRATYLLSASLAITVLLSFSPVIYSPSFRLSPGSLYEQTGPLAWGIPSPAGTVLLFPLAILTVWFASIQLKRMNRDLLGLALAIPLFVTSSLPGAPIGWTLWSLPLIIVMAAPLALRFRALTFAAVNLSSLFYALDYVETSFDFSLSELQQGLAATSIMATSVATSVLLWREHYPRSDFVRLRSRPALILIAGDSGVGKDSLADGLARILGRESTVHISGDDYHRWDRGHGSWRHLTHLNPNSNELPQFFNDVLTLSGGGDIRSGKYDHRIGRRLSSKTARSREFVIASGLHALLMVDINRHATLNIFLEMSEHLRSGLKLARDTESRGHSAEDVLKSIQSRSLDSQRYIQPQRSLADLVIKSSIIDGARAGDPPIIQVQFESEPKVFDAQLLAELGVTCSLETTLKAEEANRRSICVVGDPSQADLSAAFRRLEPRISAILGEPFEWSEGPAGVVQMVATVYLAHALRRERLINWT